jgi:hypothetical protein
MRELSDLERKEREAYLGIKKYTIKFLRLNRPFTYTYNIAKFGYKNHGVNPVKSFWYGTNAGLDHYRLTRHIFPKYAKYNSLRHAADKTLEYIISHIEDEYEE